MTKPSIEPLKIAIKAIQEQEEKERKWEKTFNEMLDGRFISQASITLNTAICKILKEIYHDEDDIIGWWMYEKDFGKRKDFDMRDKNKKVIPTDTVEDLYNALMYFYFQEDKSLLDNLIEYISDSNSKTINIEAKEETIDLPPKIMC